MRGGADVQLPRDRETGKSAHTLIPVYREMLLIICREYPGLPDPRTLRTSQIRFFYEPLRDHVLKPKKQPSTPRPRKRGR